VGLSRVNGDALERLVNPQQRDIFQEPVQTSAPGEANNEAVETEARPQAAVANAPAPTTSSTPAPAARRIRSQGIH
jgi:hypothetical protein